MRSINLGTGGSQRSQQVSNLKSFTDPAQCNLHAVYTACHSSVTSAQVTAMETLTAACLHTYMCRG